MGKKKAQALKSEASQALMSELTSAIENGQTEIVETICKEYPQIVNEKISTQAAYTFPLQYAAGNSPNEEIINIVEQAGGDVFSKDGVGNTPFLAAMCCGKLKNAETVLQLAEAKLIDKHMNDKNAEQKVKDEMVKYVNIQDKLEKKNPLHYVTDAYTREKHEGKTVDWLLNMGVKPDVKDKEGRTPLSYLLDKPITAEYRRELLEHDTQSLLKSMGINLASLDEKVEKKIAKDLTHTGKENLKGLVPVQSKKLARIM